MGINQPTVTVRGRVGTEPRYREGTLDKVEYASFRLAVTPSRRDPAGEWIDETTQWYTVKTWKSLAAHVWVSLRVGDPVLVWGELSFEDWVDQSNQTQRTAVVTAHGVGHDLRYGVTRIRRSIGASTGPTDMNERVDEPALEDDLDDGRGPELPVDMSAALGSIA